jgi:hypothetical protein
MTGKTIANEVRWEFVGHFGSRRELPRTTEFGGKNANVAGTFSMKKHRHTICESYPLFSKNHAAAIGRAKSAVRGGVVGLLVILTIEIR